MWRVINKEIISMTAEAALTDSVLRNWRYNVDRAGKFFASLSEEQLLREIALRKNRLIYLWSHLTAISDALLPLLGFRRKTPPDLDPMFVSNLNRHTQKMISAEVLNHN
jgi:hypothetical protein